MVGKLPGAFHFQSFVFNCIDGLSCQLLLFIRGRIEVIIVLVVDKLDGDIFRQGDSNFHFDRLYYRGRNWASLVTNVFIGRPIYDTFAKAFEYLVTLSLPLYVGQVRVHGGDLLALAVNDDLNVFTVQPDDIYRR